MAPRSIALALAAAGLLGSACGGAAGQPSTSPTPVGRGFPYHLYTHCGVLSARLDGTTFYADPPLTDGEGNPPRGWGNPFDDGTMTIVDPTTAVFQDPAGHRAHFTTTPRGGTPSIPLCS